MENRLMYPKFPSTNPDPQPNPSNVTYRRERGGCLNIWLVLSTGITIFSVMTLLAITGPGLKTDSVAYALALTVLVVVNLVCLLGIWKWKRWGVYGIVATSIASAIIELMFGRPTAADFIAPIIQIGIL